MFICLFVLMNARRSFVQFSSYRQIDIPIYVNSRVWVWQPHQWGGVAPMVLGRIYPILAMASPYATPAARCHIQL